MNNLFLSMLPRKITLLVIQLVLSTMSTSLLLWELVNFAKPYYVGKLDFNTWAYIFFHPMESSLLNYLFTAAFIGICALFFYGTGLTSYIRKRSDDIGYPLLAGVLALSLSALGISGFFFPRMRLAVYAVVSVIPLTLFLMTLPKPVRQPGARLFPIIASACSCLILFVMLLEPFFLMQGPVHLMNEYQDLYGETRTRNGYINNKDFLNRLGGNSYDFSSFQKLWLQYKASKKGSSVLSFLKREDLRQLEAYQDLERKANQTPTAGMERKRTDNQASAGSNTDIEDAKSFYLMNKLEYQHQNMARGQINHIGHIFNPLNEYQLGKPLDQTYLQYGIGNTFLMKWVMDLCGGISLQTFYKCYVFYLFYVLLFLVMLIIVFRGDGLFVLGSFMVYAFAFFSTGFIGFVLAPGIIPSSHMFDVVVAILLALYFQRRNTIFFILATLASMVALLFSFQFGGILSLAFILTMAFFLFEKNLDRNRTCFATAIVVAMLALDFVLLRLVPAARSAHGFRYFLLGYFSWEPNKFIVMATILFLIVSYVFILLLRKNKEPIKYVYTFSFMYSQGLLVYYYWSGLINHLPLVLPFIGMHFFLMLFIACNVLFSKNEEAKKRLRNGVAGIMIPLSLFVMAAAFFYYTGKQEFYSNFSNHRIYQWEFPRARVMTTIDPRPIREAISLINTHANADKGIYIISRYDNLLPFLACKYSLMPQFELAYTLISKKETEEAVETIQENKPRFLFVDTGIDLDEESFDPWKRLFLADFDKNERASRYGRLFELKKVFDAVRDDYKRIAGGKLISVYERIPE